MGIKSAGPKLFAGRLGDRGEWTVGKRRSLPYGAPSGPGSSSSCKQASPILSPSGPYRGLFHRPGTSHRIAPAALKIVLAPEPSRELADLIDESRLLKCQPVRKR
jgi:hypothetical protein